VPEIGIFREVLLTVRAVPWATSLTVVQADGVSISQSASIRIAAERDRRKQYAVGCVMLANVRWG
jgi:hypothetical protein